MTARELIAVLEDTVAERGDLPVVVEGCDFSFPWVVEGITDTISYGEGQVEAIELNCPRELVQ